MHVQEPRSMLSVRLLRLTRNCLRGGSDTCRGSPRTPVWGALCVVPSVPLGPNAGPPAGDLLAT